MSGIFGIIQRDGGSLPPTLLPTMRDAMMVRQPDGVGLWQDGAAGMGSLLRHNTPESVYEQLPLLQEDRGQDSLPSMVLTAAARLDNREELCDLLAVARAERAITPDSRLMLRAYERWGQECPSRLLGDWSFAVWHPREQRLFLARDQHGHSAVYYWGNGRRFAFASDCQTLLAVPHIPRRLNELYLAQVLVAWPGYHGQGTVYQDIHRLPPAHSLSVTRDGVRIRQYWHLEDAPDLSFSSEDDCSGQFLELYAGAVRSRLRSLRPIGVTLSGGLDSGAVAVLAGEALGLRTPVTRIADSASQTSDRLPSERALTAFTSVPLFDVHDSQNARHFGDEWPLAAVTARAAGVTEHIPVDARQTSPLEGLRGSLDTHGEPLHAGGNYYWINAILEQARARGLGTLLTGQGGNATVSWTGLPQPRALSDLWQRGLYRDWSKGLACSLLPASWERRLRWARSARDLRFANQPWRSYSAIHPAFARRLGLADQMLAAGHDPVFSQRWPNPRSAQFAIIKPGHSILGAFWAQNGARHGLEVRDPTMDIRLMEFCLGIPDRYFFGPGGLNRWVLRRSMAGLMPDEVRLTTKRGLQGADISRRLLQNKDELGAELARVCGSPMASEYLDLDFMQRVFGRNLGQDDSVSKRLCDTVLLRGLQAGMFLRDFEQSGQLGNVDRAAA